MTKVIISDKYELMYNPKATLPKEYKDFTAIWHLREGLLALWEGGVTEVAIPALGVPGYDYEDFADILVNRGIIKNKPKFHYYNMVHD